MIQPWYGAHIERDGAYRVDCPSLYFYFVNHRYDGKGRGDDKVLDISANRFQQ